MDGELQGFFKTIIDQNSDKIEDENVLKKLQALKQTSEGKSEEITVKKFGKQQKLQINEEKNMCLMAQVNSILDKNKCEDIFVDMVSLMNSDGRTLQPSISFTKRTKQKFERKKRQLLVLSLKLVIGLKAVQGKFYLLALLKKITLVKELFIFDIEEGQEVFIPHELSQDKLPYTMRYYDPVLGIL